MSELQLAEQVIRTVLETAAGAPCLTCSFQAEDMVVLDLVRRHKPDIAVVFLETGYHFPETYAYRDRMVREWGLNLINAEAAMPVAAQESAFGLLYSTQPDRCCHLRKVEPLFAALDGYGAWFTGLRREQSPTRANLKEIEEHRLPGGRVIPKASPLAGWTWKEVWSYLVVNEIEPHPLYEKGYLSIGCQPCTSLPKDAANPRSGRWGGTKLECGIHTFGQ